MKTFKIISCMILVFLVTPFISPAAAEDDQIVIQGVVKNAATHEPVPYATVAVLNASDSVLIHGTVSNIDGDFKILRELPERCILRISHMSYQPLLMDCSFTDSSSGYLGTLLLKERSLDLKELVVVGRRIKARAEEGKTIYFMTDKLRRASHSGLDVLTFVPGVQLNFDREVSLAGSSNIVVLVDGIERDMDFLGQLDPRRIDRIEVSQMPGANYDADVSGVIHVKLKDQQKGLSGRLHLEVPTSSSEVYIMPKYSVDYAAGKWNFHSSYQGDIRKFDVERTDRRSYHSAQGPVEVNTNGHLVQDEWSHRFDYGVDYSVDESNRFNFYGFFNPFSVEFDGKVDLQTKSPEMDDFSWSAQKDDQDRHAATFYSLFYEHLFDPNQSLTFDLSHYHYHGRHTTRYFTDSSATGLPQVNESASEPGKNSAFMKIDYSTLLTGPWRLEAGIKNTWHRLNDDKQEDFQYSQHILAGYGQFSYNGSDKQQGLAMKAGLRLEQSASRLKKGFAYSDLLLLPHANFHYPFDPNHHIALSYKRSVHRPALYELNPASSRQDPFMVHKGNAQLKPEVRHDLSFDYSLRWSGHHLSTRLFYQRSQQVIGPLFSVNGASRQVERELVNLGDVDRYGIQLQGALKLFSSLTVNPYIRGVKSHFRAHETDLPLTVQPLREWSAEAGVSAIAAFRNGFTASARFQYNSPRPQLQGLTFSDALYFVTLEKTFYKRYRVGFTSGVPFSRSFAYRGDKTRMGDYYGRSCGRINLSGFPVWLRFSYRFASGEKAGGMQREIEQAGERQRKGF